MAGTSQAEVCNGQINETVVIGMEAIPADQQVESSHNERQSSLEVHPNVVHDLLEMTNGGQHRQDGFDNHAFIVMEWLTEEKILLLGQLTDDLDAWNEVNRSYSGDIFCGLFLDRWNEGFELSPEVMKKLADRNLKIGFDVYTPTYN